MKFSISRRLEGGVVEHASTLSSTELDIINTVITEKALRVSLSYETFSGQNLRKILKPFMTHLSLQPNYSKSWEGSTSHFPARPNYSRS